LVSLIQREDEEFKIWRIRISELAEFLGIDTKYAYSELKKATYAMLDRKLKLKTFEEELQMNWLSSAYYLEGSGVVELEISDRLKPFLLKLKKNFTKYNFENVITLKSSYSIRIYELLKQFEKIGKRNISIDEFKGLLGIENKYKYYGNIKDKIIKKSQKELAEKTDIKFWFKEIKEGKKITGIIFMIEKNIKQLKPKEKSKYRYTEKMDKLCSELTAKCKRDKDKFNTKLFIMTALKKRRHPEAIIHTLKRLIESWDTAKGHVWAYGESVLSVESGNYHEADAIKEHEKMKREQSDWFSQN